MAIGDKLPVVMGAEKATPGGVATLGSDGILSESQRPAYTAEQVKAADLTLSNLTNPQQALANLGAGVRPNLLDNAYFVGPLFPVNQLNQTSYSGVVSCWDRWQLNNAQATLTKSGDQWTLTNGDPSTARNVLYQTVADLSAVTGKTATVSLLYAGSGTAGCTLYGDGGSFQGGSLNGANGFATTTISIPSTLSNYLRIQILTAAGSSIVPIAMKLEEGSNQTLAYQDSSGKWRLLPQPDMKYGAQLAQCQRYLVVLRGFGWIGSGVTDISTQGQFFIPLPVTMRTVPTISGTVRIYNYLNDLEDIEISASSISSNGIHGFFKIGSGSTLSSGDAVFLWLNTDEQLIISAEL